MRVLHTILLKSPYRGTVSDEITTFSGSLRSPSFNFYILVCTLLWIILWVSIRGGGRGGVYIPRDSVIPPPTPFLHLGETHVLWTCIYFLLFFFWKDNIPTNPLKVWNHLLWILTCQKSLVLEGAIRLLRSLAGHSRSPPHPHPTHTHTWGRHIFCKCIFSY